MMNINKVLDIINNEEYVKIEEAYYNSNLCPYSDTKYTITLKEGGIIRITQIFPGEIYRIQLFVPNEIYAIECWEFKKGLKIKWLFSSRQANKDQLYDEVKTTFYNIYHKLSMKKYKERPKYFPQ